MDFRFPHPFENVRDAFKAALDPDTPEDGSLVTQLMNENNRAIEDHLTMTEDWAMYYGYGSHGPGTDLGKLFTFTLGSSGFWIVQVSVEVLTDATSGLFSIDVDSGGGVSGTSGLSLSSTGDGSGVVTGFFGVLSDVAVLCSVVAPGATSIEFNVRVTAYRIS